MISKNVEETAKIGEKFAQKLISEKSGDEATVVALRGDLGSGKTVFVQAVAKTIGIKDQVVSPTFVIEKIYKINGIFTHLVHIDAYRIEDESELRAIGFDEILKNPGNLIFIEWPEKIKGSIPKNHREISFKHASEKEREITIGHEKK